MTRQKKHPGSARVKDQLFNRYLREAVATGRPRGEFHELLRANGLIEYADLLDQLYPAAHNASQNTAGVH
jgi:hypothetical protein